VRTPEQTPDQPDRSPEQISERTPEESPDAPAAPGAWADPAIVIIGAGFSGLGMAIRLKQAGMDDFVICEKSPELGGTWWENTYPGCGCDVRSMLYSFSFEPKSDWSREFALQAEILEYINHCADKYDLRRHIRFRTEVTAVEFDDDSDVWRVYTRSADAPDDAGAAASASVGTSVGAGAEADGDGGADRGAGEGELRARVVVAGLGPLHQPSFPVLPGLDRFAGKAFHSAQWDHSYDLRGKRVAVIGTGASAIQFVPRVAGEVASLKVFQRTPPWVIPKPDREFRPAEHRMFRTVPGYRRAYRNLIYWQQEALFLIFKHPRLNNAFKRVARWHLRRQVPDPELRRRLTPDYDIGCKRMLPSNDYYPALTRSNVELVTDGITEVRENAIVTADGTEHEVDAIIYGTGFRVTDAFDEARIVGRDGLKIQEAWREGIEAYLGVTVSGFPNLFLLLGPHSGLGHNSMIFIIEAQTRYVLDCLRLMSRTKARRIEVRPGVQRDFNRWVQEKSQEAVWVAGGCKSWYLDGNGVNRAAWPASTIAYWWRTRRARPGDFDLSGSTDHAKDESEDQEKAR
jgi:cation diffusion facilitator CzcD-associated flavoprotein CzcO